MTLNATPGDESADALIDRAYFTAWVAAQGYDISSYDVDDDVDPAIRRGSRHLNYDFQWKGDKVNGRSQPQAWPRDRVYDAAGEYVDPDDGIPTEIEQAAAAASYQELISPGSLTPVVTGGQQKKSTQVGPLRKEYFAAPTNANAYKPTLTLVGSLVAGLVLYGSDNALVGVAYRV